MTFTRSLVHSLVDKPALGSFRLAITLQHARKDEAATKAMAARSDVASLRYHDLSALRQKSDTLFILGSGLSVLELSQSEFSLIDRNCSVGLNSWALHDFVPDAYSFEEVESDLYEGVAASLGTALDRPEVLEKNPLVLMLRPHASTPAARLVSVPKMLRQRVRYYGRVTLVSRKLENLAADLSAILRTMAKNKVSPLVTLDAGMSVSRLVTLGARANFKEIVLVGVDLASSDYFFDGDPSFLERRGITTFDPWINREDRHDTESRRSIVRQASVFLPALAGAVRDTFGATVSLASPTSMLSAHLPVFDWNA